MTTVHDVLVIGGGVIGLSLAYELAGQGGRCAVIDQRDLGQESSWAGAGILPPGNLSGALTPEARLRAVSHELWPQWSARLLEETGIDNGFVRCGGLEVCCDEPGDPLDAEYRRWYDEGVAVEKLSGAALFNSEPALTRRATSALRWPEMGQVRNPRHLKALIAACARRHVALLPGTPVSEFIRDREKIVAAQTLAGRLTAGSFVVATGAWSAPLLTHVGCRVAVQPIRGQIVLLACDACPASQIIQVGPRYLVPRSDGRILVGSTEEAVGFDKRNTAEGVGGLIEFAISLVPDLRYATVERTWAGLRPYSADGLPYLGRATGIENLFVAAGHFRTGLQMSPGTAHVMAQLILGRATTIPLDCYAVDRVQSPESPVARAPKGA
ncbi:MAG: glycine oxidase ThiO [Planctomycetaceae bacterium]